MKPRIILSLLVFSAITAPASAQSTKVLQGKEITESALVEALTPAQPMRTRSLKAIPNQPSPKSPSASILITFVTNSAQLAPQARQSLDVVAQALSNDKLASYHFAVEGHADPRGSSELNQRLSAERAESVRQYLVQNHGIGKERLKAIGKGDKEPINEKNPAAPENRRVTIVTVTQ